MMARRSFHLLLLVAVTCLISSPQAGVKAFHISTTRTTISSSSYSSTTKLYLSSSSSTPKTPQEMFASEGWKPIKKELDTLPIFCCANEQGQPLQYKVNDETTMPFFYCNVTDALGELKKAQAELKQEIASKLGIIPFPMGAAFELMANNQAAIVPCATALQNAGAPPNASPLGQQVPLFCCMEIMQEGPNNRPVLPIFMVHAEAHAAMKEAVATDGGDMAQFEIVSLSLPRAVELLATQADAPAFHFLPPQSSIAYIQQYLEGSDNSGGSTSGKSE